MYVYLIIDAIYMVDAPLVMSGVIGVVANLIDTKLQKLIQKMYLMLLVILNNWQFL